MKRQIVYPGAIPLETDLLNTNKNTMIGLSKLASAVLGTTTQVNGFACTPTSPASLQVNIGAGEIYAMQNVDGTAYSSIAADTAHQILKQGILLDGLALTCAAPTTVGQSINYLIQATFAETDTTSVVLPYYNASNPSQAYSGPNNSGSSQYTVRDATATITAKAGISAATGSQVTPAADSGYVGLYVVTVAYGQTTITAGNISTVSGAPFISQITAASLQTQAATSCTTTGTAPAFVATTTPAISALTAGTRLRVKFHAAGAGNDTLAIGSLAAKSLKQYDSTGAKVAGVIAAGQLVDVEYDGVDFVLLDPLPSTRTGMVSSYASDLNNVTVSGFYRVGNTELNRPSDYGQLLVMHGASDTITQIFGDYATGNLITRSGAPSSVGGIGSWSPWKTLATTDQLAGYSKFGIGQTKQNMNSSRSLGTTYTNTTGNVITVSGYCSNVSNGILAVVVAGQTVWYFTAATSAPTMPFYAEVAPGETYSVTTQSGSLTLTNWVERR